MWMFLMGGIIYIDNKVRARAGRTSAVPEARRAAPV